MTAARFAVLIPSTGLLIALGKTERGAWAAAKREARVAGIDLDDAECREAGEGKIWREQYHGGIVSAIEVDAAAAALGRKGGAARTPAKASAAKANGSLGGRPRKVYTGQWLLVRDSSSADRGWLVSIHASRSEAALRAQRGDLVGQAGVIRTPRGAELVQIVWHVVARNQGQIVTEHQPQILGGGEGSEGTAEGLRLRTDASDRTWALYRGEVLVGRGKGDAPDVAAAMALEQ